MVGASAKTITKNSKHNDHPIQREEETENVGTDTGLSRAKRHLTKLTLSPSPARLLPLPSNFEDQILYLRVDLEMLVHLQVALEKGAHAIHKIVTDRKIRPQDLLGFPKRTETKKLIKNK